MDDLKRVALESLRMELAAEQRLLKIQIEENYKAQEHIVLLDAEVDALRNLAESKQLKINELKDIIVEKEDEIKSLQSKLKDSAIEKRAFDELDGSNGRLLSKLKECQDKITQLDIELKIERSMKFDKSLYDDTRAIKVAAMEVILTSQMEDLKQRYELAQKELSEKTETISSLSSRVCSLEEALRWSEFTRMDQIARSRQSEYRSLAKLEDVSLNYYKALDDKEVLQQSAAVQAVRGDMLQVNISPYE